jgi:integrase/recombinase XerD
VLDDFSSWLLADRGLSSNTREAYLGDLRKYLEFLAASGRREPSEIRPEDVHSFIRFLGECGEAPSTMKRELSSIRAFHRFLMSEALARDDPTRNIAAPRMWKRVPAVLTVPEVEKLMAAPDTGTDLGLRDRAMLEFTYATGMRVSEVIGFALADLNLKARTARCVGKRDKQRVVPVGTMALRWVRRYVEGARVRLVKGRTEPALFVSRLGKGLSRMGFWKILRKHVTGAGIRSRVTPHILRHSCATHMLDGGAGLRDVQEFLGHEDISTTEIYTRVDMEYLRDMIITFHPREKKRRRR